MRYFLVFIFISGISWAADPQQVELKEDWPGVPKGTILNLNAATDHYISTDGKFALDAGYGLSSYLTTIVTINEGDIYYSIDPKGNVVENVFTKDSGDLGGNMFSTMEEAKVSYDKMVATKTTKVVTKLSVSSEPVKELLQ